MTYPGALIISRSHGSRTKTTEGPPPPGRRLLATEAGEGRPARMEASAVQTGVIRIYLLKLMFPQRLLCVRHDPSSLTPDTDLAPDRVPHFAAPGGPRKVRKEEAVGKARFSCFHQGLERAGTDALGPGGGQAVAIWGPRGTLGREAAFLLWHPHAQARDPMGGRNLGTGPQRLPPSP